MHEKLLAIKENWDKELDGGRDEDAARQLSREFIDENPERFTTFAGLPQEGEDGLVHTLEVFRDAGPAFEEKQWEVQAWLFAKFPPQRIGGNLGHVLPVNAELRGDNVEDEA